MIKWKLSCRNFIANSSRNKNFLWLFVMYLGLSPLPWTHTLNPITLCSKPILHILIAKLTSTWALGDWKFLGQDLNDFWFLHLDLNEFEFPLDRSSKTEDLIWHEFQQIQILLSGVHNSQVQREFMASYSVTVTTLGSNFEVTFIELEVATVSETVVLIFRNLLCAFWSLLCAECGGTYLS